MRSEAETSQNGLPHGVNPQVLMSGKLCPFLNAAPSLPVQELGEALGTGPDRACLPGSGVCIVHRGGPGPGSLAHTGCGALGTKGKGAAGVKGKDRVTPAPRGCWIGSGPSSSQAARDGKPDMEPPSILPLDAHMSPFREEPL